MPPANDGRCVVYARVSSGDQKEDLDRQMGRVVEWATQQGYRPDEVVKEIGSGLNGNRRQLRRVVGDHTVRTIVVEHRERLCRFGFEYMEAALAGRGARIIVLDEGELEDGLVRDVTEVMTSLCARLYGKRSARRRAERAMSAAAAAETAETATGGCQLCVAAIADDGTLNLRLRLPDCLAGEHGKYLVIQGLRFAVGEPQVLAALHSNAEYAGHRRRHGEKEARAADLGQAVSYRFKRDDKGWRVFVSTRMMNVPVVTDQRRGAIGVDLNADHLAVAETDASGNYVSAWRVPLVTYGKNTRQAEALIGDAVASVVEYAKEVGKPIVIEKLDFRQKKASLEGESPKYSRMLSSFSYGKIKAYFISRGYRKGVEVHQVNPAFSSVIGRVKFMERYGLSVHQAAALVLARRLLGCSERIPRRWVCPIGSGAHVTFAVPVRKRVKHVWTYWGAVSGQLRPALAAQHRLGKQGRRPNPVRAVVRVEARGVA